MSPRDEARRRRPAGLLGALGLILLVELGLARHGDRFLTVGAANYRFSGRTARTEAPGCDVLILGDSLLKYGALPRVLEARLGGRAYNLANIGGQPPATYFLLRRALGAGARPAAVVVDFKANLLAIDPRINLQANAELMGPRDCLELGRVAGDFAFAGKLLLARALPSLRVRERARVQVLAALRGEGDPAAADVPPHWRNWRVNAGAQPMPRDPSVADRAEFWDEKDYLITPWRCHPTNVSFLKRTLRLARAYGVPVYWVIPPIHPRVQARREALGLDAAYLHLVRTLAARHPGVTVVDGRHAGYAAGLFVDAAHLDRHGAAAFSGGVAEVLARRLRPGTATGDGGPAETDPFVALPPYRDPPAGVPVEDVAQSRLALRGADDEPTARR